MTKGKQNYKSSAVKPKAQGIRKVKAKKGHVNIIYGIAKVIQRETQTCVSNPTTLGFYFKRKFNILESPLTSCKS